MKEKGLVSLAKKKNKQIFIAEKPEWMLNVFLERGALTLFFKLV